MFPREYEQEDALRRKLRYHKDELHAHETRAAYHRALLDEVIADLDRLRALTVGEAELRP